SDIKPTEAERAEGISIVRPVCGLENFSEETLSSAFRLDYPNYEILFCVAQPADPVLPLVRRLIELNPDVPARLLIGNEGVSANPKLNNVVKGWLAASHPWIVMADSNVLMPPDYMRRMLTTWRADTGLVSSPAVGCAPANIWAELECAFLNTYQVRWQCLPTASAWALRRARRCCFAGACSTSGRHSRARARSCRRRRSHQARSKERFTRARGRSAILAATRPPYRCGGLAATIALGAASPRHVQILLRPRNRGRGHSPARGLLNCRGFDGLAGGGRAASLRRNLV